MDLISAGYFLIKPMRRDAWHPAHLVRDPIISAGFYDEVLPDTEWFSDGDLQERANDAARLGLTEAEGDRIQAWFEANYRANAADKVRWPTVFVSIDALRELISVIGRVPSGFIAIGIALPRELVPRMLTEPNGPEVWGQLQASLQPAAGHQLGWEILGRETVGGKMQVLGFVSWLGNMMEVEAEKEFGIVPNEHGFIERYEDARKVAEYCDKVQPEPGVWLPWLITQYEI
jgi:hypothetical protein